MLLASHLHSRAAPYGFPGRPRQWCRLAKIGSSDLASPRQCDSCRAGQDPPELAGAKARRGLPAAGAGRRGAPMVGQGQLDDLLDLRPPQLLKPIPPLREIFDRAGGTTRGNARRQIR